MRGAELLIAAIALSGCAAMRENARCTDDRAGEVCRESWPVLQCSTLNVRVYEEKTHWRATGCGREVHCDTIHREWVCTLVPSAEQRARSVLSVRTGCAESQISVVATSPTPDGWGTFRMGGCGLPWICTVTEAKAECTPAEDWRPAVDATPGAPL